MSCFQSLALTRHVPDGPWVVNLQEDDKSKEPNDMCAEEDLHITFMSIACYILEVRSREQTKEEDSVLSV